MLSSSAILTKKDEFVDGVMKLGVIAKSVSAELSSHNVEAQLLKVLPSAFDWTPSPEVTLTSNLVSDMLLRVLAPM